LYSANFSVFINLLLSMLYSLNTDSIIK
jgi:hypothetical protein